MANNEKWVQLYRDFFNSDNDVFKLKVKNPKTRNTVSASIRSYLLDHKLYKKYYVMVERGTDIVQIRKF